jgi:Flp pilus assembly protein TadD
VNKPSRFLIAAALGAAALGAAAATATTTTPNLARALEEQERLVAAHPQDAAALNDLGNLLQLASRPEEAEAAYRRALEAAPERVPARYNLALLLHRAGRLGEALAEYRAVVEHDPAHAWARYQIGAVYEAQGDERRAVRWYGEAFALEPRLAFPEYNPGVIENGLLEEAMLSGYRAERGRPLAPQVYEQPARIRDLMLPAAEAAPAAAEAAAEPAAAAAAEPPPVEAAPETLSREDLDERAGLNQAAPQGGGRPRARYRPAAEGSAGSQVRTWQRPEEVEEDPEGRPVVAPGTVIVPGVPGQTLQRAPAPAPRVIAPGGTVRYRPGVRSTGRLELELVPSATERRG